MWNLKNTSNVSNNTGNWNRLKITQKIPEQHTGKARHERARENSHIGHSTHTAGSADIKEQNIYDGK
jgi:hypothetical protein